MTRRMNVTPRARQPVENDGLIKPNARGLLHPQSSRSMTFGEVRVAPGSTHIQEHTIDVSDGAPAGSPMLTPGRALITQFRTVLVIDNAGRRWRLRPGMRGPAQHIRALSETGWVRTTAPIRDRPLLPTFQNWVGDGEAFSKRLWWDYDQLRHNPAHTIDYGLLHAFTIGAWLMLIAALLDKVAGSTVPSERFAKHYWQVGQRLRELLADQARSAVP